MRKPFNLNLSDNLFGGYTLFNCITEEFKKQLFYACLYAKYDETRKRWIISSSGYIPLMQVMTDFSKESWFCEKWLVNCYLEMVKENENREDLEVMKEQLQQALKCHLNEGYYEYFLTETKSEL